MKRFKFAIISVKINIDKIFITFNQLIFLLIKKINKAKAGIAKAVNIKSELSPNKIIIK